eukprot:PRCOL_00003735-RA
MPKRHKKRSLGTKSHKGIHKSKRLERFLAKGVDQCWEEFQAADGDPDGMRKPELDDDLPGQGRFYCAVTARHFETAAALESHKRTKKYKKRLRELNGERPHDQYDAMEAAGMGPVDNGPRLRGSKLELARGRAIRARSMAGAAARRAPPCALRAPPPPPPRAPRRRRRCGAPRAAAAGAEAAGGVATGEKQERAFYHEQQDFSWEELYAALEAKYTAGGFAANGAARSARAVDAATGAPLGGYDANGAGESESSEEEGAAAIDAVQAAYWEDFYRSHSSARVYKERRYLLEAFPALQTDGQLVVELGCGHGSAALPVLRGPGARGSRVVGVDRSSEAVALAASAMRELGYAPERFEAHVGDVADGEGLAERLGLAGRADCVLYVFTLNSVSPQDAAAALRAAAAMLKPGGR